MKRNFNLDTLDKSNAQVLAELVVDDTTTENLRVQILNKLLQGREGLTFFQTLYEEMLSLGTCPNCNHENHWVIPEDELNQMGWVSKEKDPRVTDKVDETNCPEFQEACLKKKITV